MINIYIDDLELIQIDSLISFPLAISWSSAYVDLLLAMY